MTASPAVRRRVVRLFLLLGGLAVPVALGGPGEYRCAPIPVEPADCPAHVTSVMECPYRIVEGVCPEATCQARCASDVACQVPTATSGAPYCVAGNCVDCWQDSQCDGGFFCRGGRCIDAVADPPGCPDVGTCGGPQCRVVSISEEPCPVCVCDSIFNRSCAEDFECQVLSSHPYQHCVYGRCVECRSDEECPQGTTCMPPGLCFAAQPHPTRLFGLWLVGWPGGLDHFSYVRFEPDGTFRRGRYDEEGAWSDDMFILSCDASEWPPSAPQLGTWEVEMTQSMQLAVRIRPNGDCWMVPDAPYPYRYMVTLTNEGSALTLRDIDQAGELVGVRVPRERCAADLASCDPPRWEDVYPFPW